MLALGVVLAVGMGAVLGLLGGGGSILTVPILVYVIGMDAKQAIATSLLVVGVTSLAGMGQHSRRGNVRWRTGLVFGAVAMLGAYGGGRVAALLPGSLLLMLFAALMLVTGTAMLRRRRAPDAASKPAPTGGRWLARLVLQGLAVGSLTGLVGAGGGFVVVPALVLLGGLGMGAAIGTSLLVIAMNSFAGLAGHLAHESIDLQIAAMVTLAAVVGSFGGAALASRLRQETLRRAFAWLVLAMATVMIYRQVRPAIGAHTAAAVTANAPAIVNGAGAR